MFTGAGGAGYVNFEPLGISLERKIRRKEELYTGWLMQISPTVYVTKAIALISCIFNAFTL
jgi:hypothetical protein